MFELLVLLLFFGLILWFLVPEEKHAAERRRPDNRQTLVSAIKDSEQTIDPRESAEQWVHSGRR
jgi:hypothetical protein